MIVIYNTRLLRFLCLGSKRYNGITLYPFIILRKEIKGAREAQYTINHERIHIQQQRELLLIVFALWYLVSYLRGRVQGLSHYEAYSDIIFEREAFRNMYDLEYCIRRKIFSFLKY